MIKVVEGDILKSPESEIIIHQTNCFTMGSGVAKAIYEKYPFVRDQFFEFIGEHETRKEILGKMQVCQGNCYQRKVINLFGQYNYGYDKKQYTDYDAFKKGLESIAKEFYDQRNQITFAIPFGIGCGLAGGDWIIVNYIIQETLKDFNVNLYKLKR